MKNVICPECKEENIVFENYFSKQCFNCDYLILINKKEVNENEGRESG